MDLRSLHLLSGCEEGVECLVGDLAHLMKEVIKGHQRPLEAIRGH